MLKKLHGVNKKIYKLYKCKVQEGQPDWF